MSLAPGAKLGPYEIIAPLGAGGMGEVVRARDTRLGRDVAIKSLPEAFAQDPERLARFEREARLLASLSHPNVAGIHGLELVEGHRYLVLEFIEGESLAQRLARGPLSVPEAIAIGRQVAAGVEAAHEAGVVHRDLKPGNIMVRPDGDVKVLDFGLAKGGGSEARSDTNLSASPTMTYAMTTAGMVLGTAAYMSPEQARGRTLDRRTDIWSFGCVLYECLTGKQAFAGETVSDIISHILQTEPDWEVLPAKVGPRLRALLKRCLDKDARRRQRDIGDVRLELEELASVGDSGAIGAGAAATPKRGPNVGLLAGVASLAIVATWAALRLLTPVPAPHVTRFEIAPPPGRVLGNDAQNAAISPDGRMVAMIVNDSSGTSSIFVRSLDALAPRELPGTKGAYLMFWSPDSRYLAFFANETALWKVAVAGGEPERICATKSARGGSWGRDGTILLAPFSNGGIFRVSANGGDPVQITHPDSAHGETGHRFPQWLPDGKHFLYAAVPGGADGKGSGYVASVDGGAPKLAGRGESGPCFDPSGWLFTTRGTRITAYPFDGSGIATNRDGITLGDVAIETQFSGGSTMTTSREGSMAYLKDVRAKQRLVWCGSDGRIASTVPVPPGNHLRVWLSPEGRRALLFTISDEGAQQLLLVDLERGTMTRVSGDGEIPSTACWSPDGQRIAYEDEATGSVLIKSLADGGVRRVLGSDRTFKQVYAWSMDGKMIVYARLDSRTRWDIWGVAADGDTVPKPLVRTPANDQFAALSPDGRWIAYMSDATGRLELFVAAPAAESVPQQVSTESAIGVAWLFGGKELWWVQPSTPPVVWKAAVVPGSSFSVGSVRPVTALPDGTVWSAPDPEGSRALAIVPAGERAQQTIVVLQGWPAALHKN